MIYGVGVDICSIEKIKRIQNKDSFLKKYFSDTEYKYIKEKGKKEDQTIAGLFAAKEALVKVLGTGFENFELTAIEVLHDIYGKPYYNFMGWAKEAIESRLITHIFLSISHDEGIAVAYAVAEI
mgnify:CR=1 FL=1